MSDTVVVTEAVRKATPADVATLARTMAAAFLDDPVMSWCYPNLHCRVQLLPECFRVIIEATLHAGGVDTAADGVAGAIWVPPGAEVDEEQMAVDLGDVSGVFRERLFTLLELLDGNHPHHEQHQYLFVLATHPRWQSRGLGSALLRSVLSASDRDGVPAYLEASSERNKQLYLRHGFEVTDVLSLPDGPPLWCMWRTPETSS